MPELRPRLTYANVMATVAVFIALGGTSYAALALSDNSVKSKHIAKGAVKRSDVGNGAVNSAKVADSSLSREDFKAGQLPAGPRGPKGDTGPAGSPSTNAVNAQNADKLDGLDSSQLQRAGLVRAGAADETEDEGFAFVIRWDELALLTTDGDADADGTLRVVNSGSQDLRMEFPDGGVLLNPGEVKPFELAPEGVTTMLIWSADGTRSWLVTCAREIQIRCHGVANRVG